MQKQKLKTVLFGAIIASETSHVFCCVLPTLFSVLSLLAGLGVVGVVPVWLESVHAILHAWEVPLIITSGVVVALGWTLHIYSQKIDCHEDSGCSHGPCEPKKDRAKLVLQIATGLFAVNLLIYLVFHRGMDVFIQ